MKTLKNFKEANPKRTMYRTNKIKRKTLLEKVIKPMII
jgi:hypothetical protein